MLGIIIILSILFLTTFVAIDQRLDKERDKLYSIQLTNLKLKLEDWSLDDIRLRPINEDEVLYITLAQLKYAGYAEKDVENPKTGKQLKNSLTFKISLVGKKVVYEIVDGTVEDTNENVDSIITLAGDDVEVYNITGSGYIDPGYTATVDGIANTDVNVSGEVFLSTAGTYQITYLLNDTKVIRNIIVR